MKAHSISPEELNIQRKYPEESGAPPKHRPKELAARARLAASPFLLPSTNN